MTPDTDLEILVREVLHDHRDREPFGALASRLAGLLSHADAPGFTASRQPVGSAQIEWVWRRRKEWGMYNKNAVLGVAESIVSLAGRSIEMQMISVNTKDLLGTLWLSPENELLGLILILFSNPPSSS